MNDARVSSSSQHEDDKEFMSVLIKKMCIHSLYCKRERWENPQREMLGVGVEVGVNGIT
jgi:hypothetical protein